MKNNKFNLSVLSYIDLKSNINNTNFIYNYTYPDVKTNIRCYVINNNNTIIFPQYIKLGISLYIQYKYK